MDKTRIEVVTLFERAEYRMFGIDPNHTCELNRAILVLGLTSDDLSLELSPSLNFFFHGPHSSALKDRAHVNGP